MKFKAINDSKQGKQYEKSLSNNTIDLERVANGKQNLHFMKNLNAFPCKIT